MVSLTKVVYCIATFLLFFLLFLYYFHPITHLDGDLGYYLKIGEVIFQNKAIPQTNLFSYTYPGFPFINANWLAEVIFYLIAVNAGFNGLTLLAIMLMLSTLAIVFITAIKKASVFPTLVLACLYIQVLYERTDIKPELFSYLFLAIFITTLYRYREHYTKWIFALVPLTLLWVNTHIYFFTGIIVLVIFLIDAILQKKFSFQSKKFITLLSVTLGALVATFVNPNLFQGATYPLFVLNNYGFTVEENISFLQAINIYNDTTFLFFGILTLLLCVSLIYSRKRVSLVDVLLTIFFTSIAFFAVRTFPLFVIGTFIPCAIAFSHMTETLLKKVTINKRPFVKIATLLILVVLLIPTIKVNLEDHGIGFGLEDNSREAVHFLEKNNIAGPIYNNFDVGNYLAYRLFPKERVFVDARPEAYPKTFFTDVYFPMQTSDQVFTIMSDKYKFNVLFIKHAVSSNELITHLGQIIKNPQWKMIYVDSAIVIFIKDTAKNKELIKTHALTEKNIIFKTDDLNDKDKTKQLANFFRAIGWENQQLEMYMNYMRLDSKDCAVLYNIAYMLDKQKRPDAQIYIGKYVHMCK